MKLGNRLPVDVGVVLAAGLMMALSGCTPEALSIAGFSTPAAAASAPVPVSAASVPIGPPGVAVGTPGGPVAFRGPVGGSSGPVGVPAGGCVDVTTPTSRVTVGSASVPHCLVVTNGAAPNGAPVGDASPPRPPVGNASAPQCLTIETPTSSVRRC